jgi:hypothetical protein
MAVIMLGRSHSDRDRYFGVLDGKEKPTPWRVEVARLFARAKRPSARASTGRERSFPRPRKPFVVADREFEPPTGFDH